MTHTRLSPDVAVSPQLACRDIAALPAAGYKGIVNARPDGEEPGQPSSADLAAEAARHGLAYCHIPVVPGHATAADARAFAAALRAAGGPTLAFCRTGKRAAALWRMLQQPGDAQG